MSMAPAEQEKFNESTLNFFRDMNGGAVQDLFSDDQELLMPIEQELLLDMAETYEVPLLDLVRFQIYVDIVTALLRDIATFYGWKLKEVQVWNLDE
jgi:hypothetical protein